MYKRIKFITNSSSTSVIAYGIEIDENRFNELEDTLPKGLYATWGRWDTVYVHIGFPPIHLQKDGLFAFPPADCLQKKFQDLQAWIDEHNLGQVIYYIEESWYNG